MKLKWTKPEGSGESVTSLRVTWNTFTVSHTLLCSRLFPSLLSGGVANSQHALLRHAETLIDAAAGWGAEVFDPGPSSQKHSCIAQKSSLPHCSAGLLYTTEADSQRTDPHRHDTDDKAADSLKTFFKRSDIQLWSNRQHFLWLIRKPLLHIIRSSYFDK